jgi:hypothetical protein
LVFVERQQPVASPLVTCNSHDVRALRAADPGVIKKICKFHSQADTKVLISVDKTKNISS